MLPAWLISSGMDRRSRMRKCRTTFGDTAAPPLTTCSTACVKFWNHEFLSR
ncbi:Uncharacterised protein [Mycobacterium tuberculosis]|nr:Uncharacterised protein [Mycobacterium tuberculosis]